MNYSKDNPDMGISSNLFLTVQQGTQVVICPLAVPADAEAYAAIQKSIGAQELKALTMLMGHRAAYDEGKLAKMVDLADKLQAEGMHLLAADGVAYVTLQTMTAMVVNRND